MSERIPEGVPLRPLEERAMDDFRKRIQKIIDTDPDAGEDIKYVKVGDLTKEDRETFFWIEALGFTSPKIVTELELQEHNKRLEDYSNALKGGPESRKAFSRYLRNKAGGIFGEIQLELMGKNSE